MCKGHIIIYLSTIIKKQTSLLIVALMFVFCVNLWGCGTEGTAGTDTAVNSVTTGTDTGVNSVTSGADTGVSSVTVGADAIAGTEGAAIMGTVAGTEAGETPTVHLNDETLSIEQPITAETPTVKDNETETETNGIENSVAEEEIPVTVICLDPGLRFWYAGCQQSHF